MPELDRKANEVFAGKVVRKDLVRKVKVGANVPVYVLEFLLGKYCASDDPAVVDMGLRVVNETLSANYVRPDEAMKAQARLKERGTHTFIDKVRVRLLAGEDKYWAELVNFGDRHVHIPDDLVNRYERLLEGGIWAQVKMEYRFDEAQTGRRSPFWVEDLKPIQVATFNIEDFERRRTAFSTDEWMDLLIRSIGLEPRQMERRLKLLMLSRLVPMVERNFNFVELGPRGTGKSFVYREVSPYAILISGGKTTVANLFFNMGTGRIGLVGLWDVVAFDEIAGIQFDEKTAVQIMKDFMESGSFSRGREEIVADASMVFVGNINQPVEVLVKSSTLFQPLPEAMQDAALIDRFHFYFPGWEAPKMSSNLFTDHYGFVVDYLAEAFRYLRKQNRTEAVDRYFSLGAHLQARDVKAVRKAVAGFLKLLHPHGEHTKDELREYLELAMEGRRRVKEQLKKMLPGEYAKTSFSYIDLESREERFVGVPEEGGRNLLPLDPQPPGIAFTAGVTDDGNVALYRIEVGLSAGTGRVRTPGMDRGIKESLDRAHSYLRQKAGELGLAPLLEANDLHVEAVDLLGNRMQLDCGVAFFVAIVSALKRVPLQAGLVLLGDLSMQGNLKGLRTVVEPMQLIMDNGGKRVLLPLENRRQYNTDVPGDVAEKVDAAFFSDPGTAISKALQV